MVKGDKKEKTPEPEESITPESIVETEKLIEQEKAVEVAVSQPPQQFSRKLVYGAIGIIALTLPLHYVPSQMKIFPKNLFIIFLRQRIEQLLVST